MYAPKQLLSDAWIYFNGFVAKILRVRGIKRYASKLLVLGTWIYFNGLEVRALRGEKAYAA
jgi:hypothetical protein